jgi:hypothetical protein
LCRPAPLPATLPIDDVVIHDVLADEGARYEPRDGLVSGGLDRARDLDLWLSTQGSALVVDRLPGHAAYPRQSGPGRLFKLMPGGEVTGVRLLAVQQVKIIIALAGPPPRCSASASPDLLLFEIGSRLRPRDTTVAFQSS